VPKYRFKEWDDGSTEPSRLVDLKANMEITAYYEEMIEVSYEPSESPTGTATITEPTTLTLSPLSVTASKGTTTTFTGKLTDSAGVGIAGKTIHFFVDEVDTGVSAVTDTNGDFTLDYTWAEAGSFTFQVRYLGD